MVKKRGAEKVLEKTFLKIKRKHFLKLFSIILLFVILISTFLFFLTNTIVFFAESEMNVVLSLTDNVLYTNHKVSKEVNISFYPNNFAWCSAECSYEMKDLSNNEVIDSNKIILKKSERIDLTYSLIPNTMVGQKMYIFEVSCKNIKTSKCLTSEKSVIESSLVVLNYDLTSEEEKIKEVYKEKLLIDFDNIKKIDEVNIRNKIFLENSDYSFFKDFNERQNTNDKINTKIKQQYNEYRKMWETYQYVELDNLYQPYNTNDNFYKLQEEIVNKSNKYNSLVSLSEKYLSQDINNFAIFSNINKNYNDLLNIHNNFYKVDNLNSVNSILLNLLPKLDSAKVTYVDKGNEDILRLKYLLLQFKYLLNQDIDIMLEYDEDISYLNHHNLICSEFNDVENQIIKHNNKVLASSVNITKINEASTYFQKELLSLFMKKVIATVNNKTLNSLNIQPEVYSNSDIDNDLDSINNYANLNNINNSKNIKFMIDSNDLSCSSINLINLKKPFTEVDKINTDLLTDNTYLTIDNNNLTIDNNNLTTDNNNLAKDHILFSMDLNETESICCLSGDCKECCSSLNCKDNTQSLYPVLFLHGHSFKENDDPKSSLNSFIKMQKRMQEDGYINAGGLSLAIPNTDSEYGYLGKIGYPISIRGTYYYIKTYNFNKFSVSTKKEDNIENYAIRLKAILEAVKFKTGMNKVNIVAHSMGGLVLREYINIFGEDNINNIVLISVPNNGLSREKKALCTLTGANRECEDLTKGSVFLDRLNTKQKDISVPILNIIGRGCGNDGDGVVNVDDAYLDFAQNIYINGTCSDYLNTDMHVKLIDPEFYPEVYDEIINFIK